MIVARSSARTAARRRSTSASPIPAPAAASSSRPGRLPEPRSGAVARGLDDRQVGVGLDDRGHRAGVRQDPVDLLGAGRLVHRDGDRAAGTRSRSRGASTRTGSPISATRSPARGPTRSGHGRRRSPRPERRRGHVDPLAVRAAGELAFGRRSRLCHTGSQRRPVLDDDHGGPRTRAVGRGGGMSRPGRPVALSPMSNGGRRTRCPDAPRGPSTSPTGGGRRRRPAGDPRRVACPAWPTPRHSRSSSTRRRIGSPRSSPTSRATPMGRRGQVDRRHRGVRGRLRQPGPLRPRRRAGRPTTTPCDTSTPRTSRRIEWQLVAPSKMQKDQDGSYDITANGDGTATVTYALRWSWRSACWACSSARPRRGSWTRRSSELKRRVEGLRRSRLTRDRATRRNGSSPPPSPPLVGRRRQRRPASPPAPPSAALPGVQGDRSGPGPRPRVRRAARRRRR